MKLNHSKKNLKNLLKSIELFFIAMIVVGVSVGILGYFYKYSEKSKADQTVIPVTFSKTEISLSTTTASDFVEVKFDSGDIPLTGATVLLQYPKDVVTAEIDATNCNQFGSNVISNVDDIEGKIVISRLDQGFIDENLPKGIICFARINFINKAVGNGTISFIDGPVGRFNWVIGGITERMTPSYTDQSVSITVSDSDVSPSPTPTLTLSPSPDPSISVSPTASPTPTPTTDNSQLTSTPTPTATPTPGGTGTSRKVEFAISLQGITKIPKVTDDIPVVVSFVKNDEEIDTRSINFKVQSDGSWKGSAQYDNLLTNNDYSVLIKGPKHLQKKICVAKPTEAISGHYSCQTGSVKIEGGDTFFDMTGIKLLAGDLPVQNGIIDAVDIIYIRNNLGSKNSEVVTRADLNYDGIVDSQDYTMIINALSFKYDEIE